ncbi:MAG: peptidoglycan DD-metalloendopeptidase family protein [Acidimicrobiia bacterium]
MAPTRRARAAAAALLAAVVATVPATAAAAADDDLEAARRRANQAAAALSDAETELAHAEDAVANVEARVGRLDARMSETRRRVREVAIRLYVEGTAPLSRLLRVSDATKMVQLQQYSSVLAGTSTDALREFRADREELRDEMAALERQQEARAGSLEALRRREQAAVAELDRLSRIAEQAAAARQREQAAQAAAAAPAASSAAPAGSAPGGAGSPAPSSNGGPAAPAAAAPPAAAAAPAAGGAGWVCPVQGPVAFSNDYGAPRGGGSSHMGNDLLAPRGTPVVANVSGTVTHRNGAVSGLAYFLAGDDGNRYFGAHLDSFGTSGRVSAGTVIGTVGDTGDASGGPPHLHFEIHPGGSGNVNPYPTLVKYC